jgi:light-regulated signal transduction histidine kinase (bacteriophytochrome)
MGSRTTSLPASLEKRELLRVLSALRRGDFSARMPLEGGGIDARIAQILNEAMQNNENLMRETRALSRRVETLHQANRELEAFNYSVSHDLRGPLSRIAGFSRALLEFHAAHIDEEGQHFLKRIDHSAHRLCELVDELLNFSRLTRVEMNEQDLNLSAMVASLAGELRAREPERTVEFEIAPDVHGWGDATLMHAALENLLENSWKFTRKRAAPRIGFGQADTVRGRAYYLRDDGAGFDMRDAERLFGPFQRLHKESEFEGNGIGLATVERIIRRHGGRIWAEGETDRGAVFYFTLPLEKPK